MYAFFEFKTKVRLRWSAWHGYQWCVRKAVHTAKVSTYRNLQSHQVIIPYLKYQRMTAWRQKIQIVSYYIEIYIFFRIFVHDMSFQDLFVKFHPTLQRSLPTIFSSWRNKFSRCLVNIPPSLISLIYEKRIPAFRTNSNKTRNCCRSWHNVRTFHIVCLFVSFKNSTSTTQFLAVIIIIIVIL